MYVVLVSRASHIFLREKLNSGAFRAAISGTYASLTWNYLVSADSLFAAVVQLLYSLAHYWMVMIWHLRMWLPSFVDGKSRDRRQRGLQPRLVILLNKAPFWVQSNSKWLQPGASKTQQEALTKAKETQTNNRTDKGPTKRQRTHPVLIHWEGAGGKNQSHSPGSEVNPGRRHEKVEKRTLNLSMNDSN